MVRPRPSVAVTPDARQQLLPSKDAPWPIDEEPQQKKLIWRQTERPPVEGRLPELNIENEVAVPDLKGGLPAVVASMEVSEARRQLVGVERGEDEIIRAHLRIEAA